MSKMLFFDDPGFEFNLEATTPAFSDPSSDEPSDESHSSTDAPILSLDDLLDIAKAYEGLKLEPTVTGGCPVPPLAPRRSNAMSLENILSPLSFSDGADTRSPDILGTTRLDTDAHSPAATTLAPLDTLQDPCQPPTLLTLVEFCLQSERLKADGSDSLDLGLAGLDCPELMATFAVLRDRRATSVQVVPQQPMAPSLLPEDLRSPVQAPEIPPIQTSTSQVLLSPAPLPPTRSPLAPTQLRPSTTKGKMKAKSRLPSSHASAPRGGVPPAFARDVTRANILRAEQERKKIRDAAAMHSSTIRLPSVLQPPRRISKERSSWMDVDKASEGPMKLEDGWSATPGAKRLPEDAVGLPATKKIRV
ncbi:hypothetical protein BV22DRAFT_1192347 [Leucogyrophana mollusca]|uniref:Uncharacterized protein n=1 Tax=Leucogyrophana mollusca TaxID=85980 RepID=A0ACB8BVU8_9AGAM|nr:hypothetical protein BV22DRAFT_1192347 [Leucogyrophana mollusca]